MKKPIRIIGILVAIIALIAVLTPVAGQKEWIIDFSPERLESRACTVYRCPAIPLPVPRSPWSSSKPKLITYLQDKAILTPRMDVAPRWYRVYHAGTLWRDGHSNFHKWFSHDADKVIRWAEENPRLSAEVFDDVASVLHGCGQMADLERAASLISIAHMVSDDMGEDGIEKIYRRLTEDIRREAGIPPDANTRSHDTSQRRTDR